MNNESIKTNKVCVDNCPLYELPNTFTPNGDNNNDLFTPRQPYRFISRVEFKVFSRWGEKVFETTDPALNWNGKEQQTQRDLPDGVYYYSGYYYVRGLNGEVRYPLPSKKGGGFIELLR
jgi:gliding motility-associated-like protein